MSKAIVQPPMPPVRQRAVYQRFDPSRIAGKMTVSEWLTFLEKSQHKYDYILGEVVQVAGASFEHNQIAADMLIATAMAIRTAGVNCQVVGSDQKVFVQEGLYYFPDMVIICGTPQIDFADAVRNPTVIVEVLSSSTESDDRTTKFRHYQRIESLQHYILVEQTRASVTHFGKLANGLWAILGDHVDLADTLTLTLDSKTIAVPVAEIYARVAFEATEPAD